MPSSIQHAGNNSITLPRSLSSSPYLSGPIRKDNKNSTPTKIHKRQCHRHHHGKSPYSLPLTLPVDSKSSPHSKQKQKKKREEYKQTSNVQTVPPEEHSSSQSQNRMRNTENHQTPNKNTLHSSIGSMSNTWTGGLEMSPYNCNKGGYISDVISCSGCSTTTMNHSRRKYRRRERRNGNLERKYQPVPRTIMLPWEVEERMNQIFDNDTNDEEVYGNKSNNRCDNTSMKVNYDDPIANLHLLKIGQNKKREMDDYDDDCVFEDVDHDSNTILSDLAASLDDERIYRTCHQIKDNDEKLHLIRHLEKQPRLLDDDFDTESSYDNVDEQDDDHVINNNEKTKKQCNYDEKDRTSEFCYSSQIKLPPVANERNDDHSFKTETNSGSRMKSTSKKKIRRMRKKSQI